MHILSMFLIYTTPPIVTRPLSLHDALPISALRCRAALIPDLPGHGRSDAPPGFGYTLPEMAAAIAALLQAEGGGPREGLGHSPGGTIAVHLAARHPEPAHRPAPPEPGPHAPV